MVETQGSFQKMHCKVCNLRQYMQAIKRFTNNESSWTIWIGLNTITKLGHTKYDDPFKRICIIDSHPKSFVRIKEWPIKISLFYIYI